MAKVNKVKMTSNDIWGSINSFLSILLPKWFMIFLFWGIPTKNVQIWGRESYNLKGYDLARNKLERNPYQFLLCSTLYVTSTYPPPTKKHRMQSPLPHSKQGREILKQPQTRENWPTRQDNFQDGCKLSRHLVMARHLVIKKKDNRANTPQ